MALSIVLSLLVFSGMQMYKQWLGSSQPLTLLGGFLGSVLFVLILTVSIEHIFNVLQVEDQLINLAIILIGCWKLGVHNVWEAIPAETLP